jgi:hypothetical protein
VLYSSDGDKLSMLQLLGASKGSEVTADPLEEAQLSSESRKQSCDGTEIAYGRSYAKISDGT